MAPPQIDGRGGGWYCPPDMRPALRFWVWVFMTAAVTVHGQAATDSRRQSLDELLRVLQPSRPPATGRINAVDRTWEDWVRRTGELRPDLKAMPSIPELPDPLLLGENGRTSPVTTPELWARRRQSLRAQVEHWIFGRMPPAPDNLRATVTGTRREGGATVRQVRLARARGARDAPGGTGDCGRPRAVSGVPDESRPHCLDLYGSAPGLRRLYLPRHRPELR